MKKNSKYWLSLEQWAKDPEFQKLAENEFMSSPFFGSEEREKKGEGEESEGGTARRTFLKLMGASMALSSFGCIRRPAQKIVPYVNRPTDLVLGVANHYASSFTDGFEGFGILVTTREGRPIKIEGNPDHPMNRGGLSARAHAHLLSLYDPERLSGPRQNLLNEGRTNRDTIRIPWGKADQVIQKQLARGGVALLTGRISSPSTQKLIGEFLSHMDMGRGSATHHSGSKKHPTLSGHYAWEPVTFDNHLQASEKCYGQPVVARLALDKADCIVSVDADFLGTYLSPTEFSRDFSRGRRKLERGMNRLVVFESLMSLTGSNADERFQIKPSQQLDVLMGLAYEIVVTQGRSSYAKDPIVQKVLQAYSGVGHSLDLGKNSLSSVAQSLWKHRGKSLVLAGGLCTQGGVEVQVAVNFLNSILENEGQTVDGSHRPYAGLSSHTEGLKSLVEEIHRGNVKTLVIHGTNPIYGAPDNMGFREALKKVEMVIYTGDRVDETGGMAHYILPDHHPMENWGDAEFQKGVYSIQQPTIRPMNDTRAFQDSLLKWMGRETTWYDFLKSHWEKLFLTVGTFSQLSSSSSLGINEKPWVSFLKKGVWMRGGQDSSLFPSASSLSGKGKGVRSFSTLALEQLLTYSKTRIGAGRSHGSKNKGWYKGARGRGGEGLELALYTNSGLRDGSMANVSWLHEFPDPVTKICWDNYATVSVGFAHEKNLREGDMVQLKVKGRDPVEVPVHIQPGQHDSVVGLALGYGRWAAGAVANGVGVRAYGLVGYEEKHGLSIFAGQPVEIKKIHGHVALAGTQGHHSMEGRQIVVEATLDEYKKNPGARIHRHKTFSLWSGHEYKGHKWAMSVDLNSCTGCGACMVACQAENNIPTVGKKHLLNGREMHWIRVDRYYVGPPKNPDTVHMPVMCQHCDNAPCETVCPVAATVHGDEGTNDMIYNRCVGTRYCANNCPYKVRRFNWFKYNDIPSPLNLALNPEVTVRSRGVMEKCTFCNHRIKDVKHRARLEGRRKVQDGEIQVACEQSCPSQAIVFGDMNDPHSKVSQEHKKANSYTLLEELNNVPAVRYRSKIRNTGQLKSGVHDGGHGEGHSEQGGDQHS